ncbi:MAG TPA: hypothetical protein VFD39_07830, partial [Trueperaceae bacterium]|nr:hypothetical protein [Trueperaceae bacterium]
GTAPRLRERSWNGFGPLREPCRNSHCWTPADAIPLVDEREQALRVASRWIEPALMARAFGWDVNAERY